LLERILLRVNPKKVIIHYFVNDIKKISIHPLAFIFQRSFALSYGFEKFLAFYYQFLFGGSQRYYEELYSDKERIAYLNFQIKKLAKHILPIEVVIIPNLSSLSGSSQESGLYLAIEDLFKKKGFSVLNTYPDFKRQFLNKLQDLWVQSDDPHPNASGHQLVFESYMMFSQGK
jgi:hypothetical protein